MHQLHLCTVKKVIKFAVDNNNNILQNKMFLVSEVEPFLYVQYVCKKGNILKENVA
jgi:hypothetical protein